MAKLLASLLCGVALVLCATIYTVNGGDTLKNDKKYFISSVADDQLILTANQGVYNKGLGTVVMEAYVNGTNQKWKYSKERGVSVFKSEKNSYNNVTTYHEKDSFHLYNDFRVTKINDDNIYVLQNVKTREIRQKNVCLQSMGEHNAVQLEPCNPENADQQWMFELLPCCKE